MELLAPAGGILQGKSAIISGADAIYLGAKEFSARSGATNFDFAELKEMVDFCHVRGKDVHLTVNTLLSDMELRKLDELIEYARVIGVDAFIIQDLGVIRRVKNIAPDVPIHGSTQMSVCNLEGVRMAEKLGLSRIVLARELSLKEIEEISKNTHLETEIFVHGAICVSYSGQCLLSSMVGGRSGNRGNCAQPCRKLYSSKKSEGYFLSPGDMCLVKHLEEIKNAGVTSLKIEGRMKSPEYVSTVTGIYRKYLDSGESVIEQDLKILKNAFCRGDDFTDGYFTGKFGISMMRPNVSNDHIYQKQDRKMLTEHSNVFTEGKEGKKVSVYGKFEGIIGEPPTLTVWDENGNSFSFTGSHTVEAPLKEPLTIERLEEQLRKLGNTPYQWEELSVSWNKGFLPIREINEMRRVCFDQLNKARIESRRRLPLEPKKQLKETVSLHTSFSLEAMVETFEQAEALSKSDVNRLYVPLKIYENVSEITAKEVIPYLPTITETEENRKFLKILKNIAPHALLCTNIGHLELARQANSKPYGSFQLNLYNTEALWTVKEQGIEHAILSVELNRAQMKSIFQKRPISVGGIIYGKLPLMTTKNCLIKTAGNGQCGCQNKTLLKDRNGTTLCLRPGEGCKTIIYNSKPIYLADKMEEIKSFLDCGVLLFTDETPQQCRAILEEYTGSRVPDMPEDFTRGHFNRGV